MHTLRNGHSATEKAGRINQLCGICREAHTSKKNQPAGIDVICGGFPCQDLSVAGKQKGIYGERSGLWSEFARIIGELRPGYVIVENVSALLFWRQRQVVWQSSWETWPKSGMTVNGTAYALESLTELSVQGAPHRRDRVWVIAYPRAECGNVRINNAEQADSRLDKSRLEIVVARAMLPTASARDWKDSRA